MAKNKPFSDADKAALRSWVQSQLDAGRKVGEIKRDARTKFGAFDWSVIVALIIEIIRKWLEKK